MSKTKTKPTPIPVSDPETPEQKTERVNAAAKALKALLDQYHVALNVSKLDISSGKIWPQIDVIALDLPK